jgi:hypothetical protein
MKATQISVSPCTFILQLTHLSVMYNDSQEAHNKMLVQSQDTAPAPVSLSQSDFELSCSPLD